MDITNNLSNSNTNAASAPPKRVRLESDDWFEKESRSRLLERWKEQDLYIDHLELRLSQLQQSIESNERLREKETECKKLKSMLNYRFLTKTTQQQSLVRTKTFAANDHSPLFLRSQGSNAWYDSNPVTRTSSSDVSRPVDQSDLRTDARWDRPQSESTWRSPKWTPSLAIHTRQVHIVELHNASSWSLLVKLAKCLWRDVKSCWKKTNN